MTEGKSFRDCKIPGQLPENSCALRDRQNVRRKDGSKVELLNRLFAFCLCKSR